MTPTTRNVVVLGGNKFTRNLSAANMPTWTAALQAVRQGTGRARYLVAGDSTGRGLITSTNVNGQINSGMHQMAAVWAGLGLPSSDKSIFGLAVIGNVAASEVFDPRVSHTGAATFGFNSLGGGTFVLNAAGSWSFALDTCDTIDIFLLSPSNLAGSGTWSVDGGAETPFSVTAGTLTPAFISASSGLSPGAHTLRVTWVSGTVTMYGVRASLSTVPAVDMYTGGLSGASSVTWASANSYDLGNAGKTLAPHLTDICLGINDWDGGTALATYRANVITEINRARTTGDAVLRTPNPTAHIASAATQLDYVNVLRELSDTYQVPLFDHWARMGGNWAAMNAAGYMDDDRHPNRAGQGYMWSWIGGLLAGL